MPAQKPTLMRDRMLHDSLQALTFDAANLLGGLLDAGAEIPFEVGDAGGPPEGGAARGATMFAYRPMTAEFVSQHADQLRALPTFENAAQNIARTRGVIAYLRVRDEPVLDVGELTHARLAALAFLGAVWDDAERFDMWGDRFERAYHELESVALAERIVTTVFIPVHGVVLENGSVNLGAGVELIDPEDLDPAGAERFGDIAIGADAFVAISVDAPSNAPTPMPAVRLSARALLTALRLFKPGSVALGMTGQADIGGAWHRVALPFTGTARDEAWALHHGEDEELRQFVNAVRRVERRTRIAWSLKRFEMGLERSVPAEGLTDFLCALRALLEAEGDSGTAGLPARVAALCAQDDERMWVRGNVEAAFALERLAIEGHISRADRKRLAQRPPLEVIAEVERYLRALLHDLVCGYLQPDLKALADEILTADGQPAGDEILEPVALEAVPDIGASPAPDPAEGAEYEAVFDDTAEISAVDLRTVDRDGSEAEDNVWTLRPAAEVSPAPVVEQEPAPEPEAEYEFEAAAAYDFEPEAPAFQTPDVPEPDAQMHAIAEDLVGTYDDALAQSMDTGPIEPAVVEPAAIEPPQWDPTPEYRPVDERPRAGQPQQAGPEGTGFTFDFQKVEAEAPAQQPAARDERFRAEADAARQDDPFFPIPEFGVSLGRGPAAEASDASVEDDSQRTSFREIMDENFTPPPRDHDAPVTTPLARDGKPHLVALEGTEPEQAPPADAQPRIVHPGVFGGAEPDRPLIPLDPQETVEYDVLAAETSAEEAAQLAWSEQFLRRDEQAPQPEQSAEAPEPKLLPPVRPVPDLVLTTFPEAQPRVDQTEQHEVVEPELEPEPEPESQAPQLSSENARSHSIGPATIEFRPVVDPDTDDPDDFAGAC